MSIFRVEAERYHCYRDDDNRPAGETEYDTLEADTLAELYDEMAKYKARHETPQPRKSYDYVDVDFGDIEEISDLVIHNFNKQLLLNSTVWAEHLNKLQDAAAKKAADELRIREEREYDQEVAERLLFAKLLDKFGNKGTL